MEYFFQDYFVNPIVERSGYNLVNTAAYGAIALILLYIIWKVLKGRGVDFGGKPFLYGVAAFVLLGSTSRVITDLWDAGFIAVAAGEGEIYAALYATGAFAYGYMTVTPGIYFVTAALFLISLAIGRVLKAEWFPFYAGIALWLPCLLLLTPFMKNFYHALLAVLVAAAGLILVEILLRRIFGSPLALHERLAIGGQALDGAATFVVLDIFSKEAGKAYFEQHVLPSVIGGSTPLGFFAFFLIKIALAGLIVYFLRKEDMALSDKALILIVVATMGFAPGIRNLLRMLCGT